MDKPILRGNVGVEDFALDKNNEKNKRVYSEKEDAKCATEGYKSVEKYRTGCPDSIPVRKAFGSTNRAGDYGNTGDIGSRWPGRRKVNIGLTMMYTAFAKISLCVQLPVCDSTRINSGTQFSGGKNQDCSAHGTC